MHSLNITHVLPRSFYDRDTVTVAQAMLGTYLLRQFADNVIIGKIVETEAYLPFDDPAAHAYKGHTKRVAICYGDAGYTYVHSLRQYHCMDIVTEGFGRPGAVLIRSIEPIDGLALMKQFRHSEDLYNLTTGPGKVCQALHITRALNGVDVTVPESPIILLPATETLTAEDIVSSVRIGISKAADLPLRFYIRKSQFVSSKKLHSRQLCSV